MQTLSHQDRKSISPTVGSCLEISLLLCCARTQVDSNTQNRIQILTAQNLDWDYVMAIATQQGVRSLLYYNLSRICPEAVPPKIFDKLQNLFQIRAQRNLFLTGELIKLLNLLEANQIAVIPFKGAVLAGSLYGNLALREFCDLDILVSKQDVPKAMQLLIAQGYESPMQLDTQEKPYLQFDQFLESGSYKRAYDFVRKDGKVAVDFHWSMTNRLFAFAGDFHYFWSHIQQISLFGKSIPSFSPEDLLLFLCLHGAKDGWSKLKWICDVAELIRTYPELKWEQVIKQSRTLGTERMLCLGLCLANQLLDANLPELIQQKIDGSPIVRSLAIQVQDRIFTRSLTDLEKYNFIFTVRERWRDKLRYLLGITTTPTNEDWSAFPLASSWHFLYYLLRPLRLGSKYIGLQITKLTSPSS